jgi:L-ascorbate metabolism protein UlaG (beta-lactamase superfamily)
MAVIAHDVYGTVGRICVDVLAHVKPTGRSPIGPVSASPLSDDEFSHRRHSHKHVSDEASRRLTPPASPLLDGILWVGHSTVLVELDGVRLLTDPVLSARIGPIVRIAAPVRAEDLGVVDCVLLSHLHADHADLATLRAVRRTGPIIAPTSAGSWLQARGLNPVIELSANDEVAIGDVTVRAVPAVHDGRRWPLGPAPAPVGFLIRGSRSVYFAGDTDVFDGMAELRGSVDLALLPVWGWGRGVGSGHLDPVRAAEVVALVAPAVVIPIHWGTFALPKVVRPATDPASPAREFARLVAAQESGVEVRLLAPGGTTKL